MLTAIRYASIILLCCQAFSVFAGNTAPGQIHNYQYEIISSRPHDSNLFTQGLFIDSGHFYESSGLYGRSLLVRYTVKPSFSEQSRKISNWTHMEKLPKKYFAEGLTLFNNKLYLLTWQEQSLLVYNRDTFQLEATLPYEGEGWGLTHDEKHLIRSDGSHHIYFHKADDFQIIRSLQVTENGQPLTQLNELEFINGKIWANIWHEKRIVEIDPKSGKVEGVLDLAELANLHTPAGSERVLNGIAWDKQQQTLWITGKMWPLLYQLKITEK